MADIIQLADRRKKPVEAPSIEQLAAFCTEEIAGNWERFARNNRLNDYFIQSAPAWTQKDANYLADLNALSAIEKKINLTLAVMAPGAATPQQLGWVASFSMNGVRVETPFMVCEEYARCFNILLFLKLGREMTQNGIAIE